MPSCGYCGAPLAVGATTCRACGQAVDVPRTTARASWRGLGIATILALLGIVALLVLLLGGLAAIQDEIAKRLPGSEAPTEGEAPVPAAPPVPSPSSAPSAAPPSLPSPSPSPGVSLTPTPPSPSGSQVREGAATTVSDAFPPAPFRSFRVTPAPVLVGENVRAFAELASNGGSTVELVINGVQRGSETLAPGESTATFDFTPIQLGTYSVSARDAGTGESATVTLSVVPMRVEAVTHPATVRDGEAVTFLAEVATSPGVADQVLVLFIDGVRLDARTVSASGGARQTVAFQNAFAAGSYTASVQLENVLDQGVSWTFVSASRSTP